MHLIEASDITKKYGRHPVLNSISFTAEAGECIGFAGANGCGKSTLLKILAGAIKASSGTLSYEGSNPFSHSRIFTRFAGYVPQDNPLFDNLTVLDNLKLFYCDSTHNLKADIADGIIAEFGIDAYLKERVMNLSGGMKKRLSLACAIAMDPRILIMDEPGASLDIVCKTDIRNYITSYVKKGGTVLIASHEEGELALCSRMFFMNDGHLEQIPPSGHLDILMERMVKKHG